MYKHIDHQDDGHEDYLGSKACCESECVVFATLFCGNLTL